MTKADKKDDKRFDYKHVTSAMVLEALFAFACLMFLLFGRYTQFGKDKLAVVFCTAVFGISLTFIVWQWQMKRLRRSDLERDSLLIATSVAYPVQVLVDLSDDAYHYFTDSSFITTPIPRSGKYSEMVRGYEKNIFPDDRREYHRLLNRYNIISAFEKEDNALQGEYRDMGTDGQYHWVSMNAYKVKNSYDNKLRAILFSRIIDEEKKKEKLLQEALIEKKQELSDVYSALQIGLVKIGKNEDGFPLRSANNSFYEMIGYTRDQFMEECGNLLRSIQYQPDDYKIDYQGQDDQGAPRITGRYRIVRRDGTLLWVRYDATSSLSEADVYYVMFTDVTNAEKAEEMLLHQKYYGALADRETPGGVIVFSILGERIKPIYVRGDTVNMIGYTNDEISAMSAGDIRYLIYEGDWTELENNFIGLMRRHETRALQQEFRLRCKNGKLIWIMAQGNLVPDYDGDDAYLCIFIDITAQKERESEVRMRSHIDQLTGALNRSAFIEQMNGSFGQKPGSHALVMLDIDDFKRINDELGHKAGDAALRQTASLLRSAMRAEDLIGRIGGDEFLIAMMGIPSEEVLQQRCTEICRRVKSLHICGRQISVSLGAAAYPADAQNFEDLYQCADTAMYETKRRGKSGYCIYSGELKAVQVRSL